MTRRCDRPTTDHPERAQQHRLRSQHPSGLRAGQAAHRNGHQPEIAGGQDQPPHLERAARAEFHGQCLDAILAVAHQVGDVLVDGDDDAKGKEKRTQHGQGHRREACQPAKGVVVVQADADIGDHAAREGDAEGCPERRSFEA